MIIFFFPSICLQCNLNQIVINMAAGRHGFQSFTLINASLMLFPAFTTGYSRSF